MRGDDPNISISGDGISFVLPACAGMIPASHEERREVAGAPRMRGDDPDSQNNTVWYWCQYYLDVKFDLLEKTPC